MKKFNVGDSVKFKDGRTGIIEDYDEKYFYIKDNNANIVRIIKDRSRLAYEYEPESEEEYESKEDRKKRHEELVAQKRFEEEELEPRINAYESALDEIENFVEINCEKLRNFVNENIEEIKQKCISTIDEQGFEYSNGTLEDVDPDDLYNVIDKVIEDFLPSYVTNIHNVNIAISGAIHFTNLQKGIFKFTPFVAIELKNGGDYNVFIFKEPLQNICDEFGIENTSNSDTELSGFAYGFEAGPFSLFE